MGLAAQGTDQGDTTTVAETVTAAVKELEAMATETDGHAVVLEDVVADKGQQK